MTQLAREQASVVIDGGGVELRTAPVGEMTVSFVKVPAGMDFGPALKGLPGDACQCPHWGYMIAGRLRVPTPSGDVVYEGGNPFYWAPGHAPVAETDAEWVEFSPTEDLTRVLNHIRGG